MAAIDSLTDLNTQTALQQARDAQAAREASVINRTTGGTLGKNDFLMLLSAQLRYQDPLNPQNDSEFASQLAQFSSLEQMQNMNETLSSMASYQAYSLVGKYALAQTLIDGVLTQVPGIVDSIFTRNGTTYAQIGDYAVPVASITDVFDSGSMLTPDMLIQTSSNLIGRTVMAQLGDDVVEGIVTRLTVDQGNMYALVDDGSGTPKYVAVGGIFDIRQTGTPGSDAVNNTDTGGNADGDTGGDTGGGTDGTVV